MAGTRPGPHPHFSESAQFTFRTEKEHLEVYKARARAAGLPLNRYLAGVLAAAHDLECSAEPDQQQLPVGA